MRRAGWGGVSGQCGPGDPERSDLIRRRVLASLRSLSTPAPAAARLWSSLVSEDVIPIVLPHTNEQGGLVAVKCLSVSPAGNLIAAGCNDGAVRVWAYADMGDRRHNTRGSYSKGAEVYRRQARRARPPPMPPVAAAGVPAPGEASATGGVGAGGAAGGAGAEAILGAAQGLASLQGNGQLQGRASGLSNGSGRAGGASSGARARAGGVNGVGGGAVVGAVVDNDLPGLGGGGVRGTASGPQGRSEHEAGSGRTRDGSGGGGAASTSGAAAGAATQDDEGLIEVRLATKLFGESKEELPRVFVPWMGWVVCLGVMRGVGGVIVVGVLTSGKGVRGMTVFPITTAAPAESRYLVLVIRWR